MTTPCSRNLSYPTWSQLVVTIWCKDKKILCFLINFTSRFLLFGSKWFFHLGRPPWPKRLLLREATSAFAHQYPIKAIQENRILTETAAVSALPGTSSLLGTLLVLFTCGWISDPLSMWAIKPIPKLCPPPLTPSCSLSQYLSFAP